jgi:hypothetical protein
MPGGRRSVVQGSVATSEQGIMGRAVAVEPSSVRGPSELPSNRVYDVVGQPSRFAAKGRPADSAAEIWAESGGGHALGRPASVPPAGGARKGRAPWRLADLDAVDYSETSQEAVGYACYVAQSSARARRRARMGQAELCR